MENLTNVKQRILYFIENQGIRISKFYAESGVSYGILTQKNKMTEDNIVKFITKYPQISPEWLLTGEGEMLRGTPPAAQKPPQKPEKPYSESAIFAELVAQRKMFEGQISRLLELLENLSKKISGESTAL